MYATPLDNQIWGHSITTWTRRGGEGGSQMSTLLHKSYIVHVRGREGVKNDQNLVHVVFERPLIVIVISKRFYHNLPTFRAEAPSAQVSGDSR